MNAWSLSSWQSKHCEQPLVYPSKEAVDHVVTQLSQLPPLVTRAEIDTLHAYLAEAAEGKRFILQGGNCAEHFADCSLDIITNKLKVLSQVRSVLSDGLNKPITCIGRIAGQYAKPRSLLTETQQGITLPNYHGDLINQAAFNEEARKFNPDFIVRGYHYAALTREYMQTLLTADQQIYTSHEALNLYYEQALTRKTKAGDWYNQGTHFPWVGMRTSQPEGGHIEYLRGIANPVAVKIGPHVDAAWLKKLVKILNPTNKKGRLTFITRLGAERVADCLPSLIASAHPSEYNVLWLCDPMHGNTHLTQTGIKTRYFNDILSDLRQTVDVHQQMDSHVGGIHLELTGEHVTECIGGACGLDENDLQRAYKSLIDPHLNEQQALELAAFVVKSLQDEALIING